MPFWKWWKERGKTLLKAAYKQSLDTDPNTGKYGAFFPLDGQIVYINPSQEADDIVFYK